MSDHHIADLNLHNVICNDMSIKLGTWIKEMFCKTRFRIQEAFFFFLIVAIQLRDK